MREALAAAELRSSGGRGGQHGDPYSVRQLTRINIPADDPAVAQVGWLPPPAGGPAGVHACLPPCAAASRPRAPSSAGPWQASCASAIARGYDLVAVQPQTERLFQLVGAAAPVPCWLPPWSQAAGRRAGRHGQGPDSKLCSGARPLLPSGGRAHPLRPPPDPPIAPQACASLECDLVCLDLSRRLPYRFKPALVKAALARGVHFEVGGGAAAGGGTGQGMQQAGSGGWRAAAGKRGRPAEARHV